MSKHIEIQDCIQHNIKYKGIVTVSLIDKQTGKQYNRKSYNTSEKDLFTAICRMLCDVDTQDYIPRYIKAYNSNLQNLSPTQSLIDADKEVFYNPVYYSASPSVYTLQDQSWIRSTLNSQDGAEMVEYSFLVPSTNIKLNANNYIKSLRLFNNRNNLCASVDFGDDAISLSNSSNILITWKLQFSNN